MNKPRNAKAPSPARTLALQWLDDCLSRQVTLLDAASDVDDEAFDSRDSALAREITRGTCRWLGRVRFALRRFAKQWDALPPIVQRILELSAYQLLFLDRVPAYAIVSDAVELTRANRLGGLSKAVNGILRSLDREKANLKWPAPGDGAIPYLTVTQSHPGWLVNRWIKLWGEQKARALCEYNNTRAPLSLRLRVPRGEAEAILNENGVRFSADDRFLNRIEIGDDSVTPWLFEQTEWVVQDGAAMLAAAAAGAQPGMRIWDACAAPGGKAFALADALRGEGSLLATDRAEARLRRLESERLGLGLRCIETRVLDILKDDLHFQQPFDLVAVDAPCTGWGAFRRHPDLRWRLDPGDSQRLGDQALAMLERCAAAVKPGGALIYSTCTLSPAENEQVVERFIQRNESFTIEPPTAAIPSAFLDRLDERGLLTIQPAETGLDGAFAARLRRRGPSNDFRGKA